MTEDSSRLRFPKRFLWGAATSAHQVEGGNHNNWTVWELENAKALAGAAKYKIGYLDNWPEIQKLASSPENYVSGRAIDHYNRYEADFDIMKKMHLNAFRFSIEWSRIEPEEGVWDEKEIEHYRRYIAALKKRGIEPLITLYHWTVPIWFAKKGAFARAGNINYFVRFADKVLEELGADLRLITTINEPDTVAIHGYYLQDHPPGLHSRLKMFWVYRNHLKAHKLIYSLAKKRSRRFRVGFVKSYAYVQPANERVLSRLATWFDYLVRDEIVLRYVGRKTAFLGVNYYFTDTYDGLQVTHDDTSVSDLGWEMRPKNLLHVLRHLGKYKKPIFIMETGVADKHDTYRKVWLSDTIRAVQAALKEGVNVQGYLYWSLFDNFEWAYGRWPCFGLVGIDYADNLRRVPRNSAAYYAAVVKKARGL
jgi:beta-glucosidase